MDIIFPTNIFASDGYHNPILCHPVASYMEDSDIANLAMPGHRRWILNPPLQQVSVQFIKNALDALSKLPSMTVTLPL